MLRPGRVPLTPQFVSFFNTAAKLSEVLYKPGSPDPKLMYTLTPSEVGRHSGLLTECRWPDSGVDGRRREAVHVAGRRQAALQGNLGAGMSNIYSYTGLWATFRLMGDAERWEPAGSGYNLEWVVRIGGKPADPGQRRSGCRSRDAGYGRRAAVLQERQPRRAALRIAGGQIECNFRLASGSTN